MTLDIAYLYSGLACPPGGTPYQWPTSREMLGIAGAFPASVWMHHGLYVDGSQYPPYIVPQEALLPLCYLVGGARAVGHTVCPYTSLFYAREKSLTTTQYLNAVRSLKASTECTGIYVDGMTFPYHDRPWSQEDNRYVARVLRNNIFGKSGTLILHATHPLGDGKFQPPDFEVEQYMSLVVIGEGCPDFGSPAAATYAKEQIFPRIESGVPWAMLNRTWPAEWLVEHGASAIGHVGMRNDGSGGTIYDNGTRTAYYQGIIAAREAAGVGG
jgi:hypothetical protein